MLAPVPDAAKGLPPSLDLYRRPLPEILVMSSLLIFSFHVPRQYSRVHGLNGAAGFNEVIDDSHCIAAGCSIGVEFRMSHLYHGVIYR